MRVRGQSRMLIRRAIETASGKQVMQAGGNAIAVVHVKTGSARMRKDFAHFCESRGVEAEPLADYADGMGQTTAYCVVALPHVMDELQGWKCVLTLELVVDIALWRGN